MSETPILDVRNLVIDFATENGRVEAVKGIS
ncbi:MAG: ABC transporter ATP-binding protein, partial [Verrucomicrobiaceae bacterium]